VKADPTFWLLARASGITAYALLTASVLAGIVLKSRPVRSLRPAAVTDTHRFLALLGLGAIALHGVALLLDRTIRLTPTALLVPGASSYRPVAVAAGVLAAELMLVVYASFSVRRLIKPRNWRRLHWATYAIFGAATVHGLAAGTDTAQPWAFDLYLAAVGSVAAATAWRALTTRTLATATQPRRTTS
jgi:DMSO/TMAO reductase YedYZ heme-binding membrane subunit